MESHDDIDGTEDNPGQLEDEHNNRARSDENSATGPEPSIPNEPRPEARFLFTVQDTAVSTEPLGSEQGSMRADSDPEQTYPKVAGAYYYDGTRFLPLTQDDGTHSNQRHIYFPGSEFCEVTGPGETTDQRETVQSEDVTSTQSSDSDSEGLDGSDIIESRATIGLDPKGFKSLNITFKLNLSDIVRHTQQQHSLDTGHRIQKKTRGSGRKARARDPSSPKERTQESQAISQSHITETNKPGSNSNPTHGNENREIKHRLVRKRSEYDEITFSDVKDGSPEVNIISEPEAAKESPTLDEAPPVIPKRAPLKPVIPPRYQPSWNDNTAEENVSGKNGSEDYEVAKTHSSPQDGARSTTESTWAPVQNESTKGMQAEASLVTTNTVPDVQTEVDEVKAGGSATRPFQKDKVLEKEVSSIQMQPWFFTFEKKEEAIKKLKSKKDQDGRFVVVCEDKQQSCVCHFTLYVTKECEKHLIDLVEHHTKHKLPYIGVKLLSRNQ